MGSEPCDFAGKRVLLVGAGGIGVELCKVLRGKNVRSISILDISDNALQSAAQSLADVKQLAVHTFRSDITKYEEVLRGVQAAFDTCGGLDIVFANAGIGPTGWFNDKEPDFFANVMNVNYMGVVHTLKATLPILVKQNSGYVMISNSFAGFAGARGMSAYCASKFAVRGLTECVRLELIGTAVNFYVAAPNFVDTPMIRKSLAEAPANMRELFKATVPVLAAPSEVAEKMVHGMEVGRYVVRSPDHICDLLVKGCLTPCMPRYNTLVMDMLLAPLYVWIHHVVKKKLDAASDWYLHGKLPPPKSKIDAKTVLSFGVALIAIALAVNRLIGLL